MIVVDSHLDLAWNALNWRLYLLPLGKKVPQPAAAPGTSGRRQVHERGLLCTSWP